MTTSLVVGRSKPGCGFPPALSFKDVHHPRWGGRRAEPGFCLPRGPAARFFLQHSGEERGSLATRRRRTSATRGRPGAGADSCRVPGSWPRWPCRRLRRCLLPFGRGMAVRPPHGRWSRRARVRHTHSFPRAAGRTGDRPRRRTLREWRHRSWMVLSSLCGRTGARTSCAEVAMVVSAEVVAAAGEAAPYRGGCLRCRDHQGHLPLSP
jgi:hypothetical protein